jgi:2-polyprenyl-3-methyl-5-hydroxy-6-metoxy-1,4-benzoquinol methylase
MPSAPQSETATSADRRMLAIEKSSYVDPNGYVFRTGQGLFRAIRPTAEAFYRGLFETGLVERLTAAGLLVDTAIAQNDGAVPEKLVLRHREIRPLTYCIEWAPSMLRDAARATVDLLDALIDESCTLQDAYPWNVLFEGAQAVHVDFTSIVRADERLIWPAYVQFQSFFLRPLYLAESGRGEVARALLKDSVSGIALETFLRYMPLSARLRHPGWDLGDAADRLIQRRPALKARIRELSRRSATHLTPDVRRRFVRGLRRALDGFRFRAAGEIWERYYREIPDWVDRKAKLEAVRGILARLAPPSVLDLGCNTGLFSIVAAEAGARVLAVDSSEACIEALYREAHGRKLAITPVIGDVLTPAPAFGFMAEQFPSFIERARSDTVLCLGLMHHLHVTGRQPFEAIAAMLDRLAERTLVFEFVANDDANVERIESNRVIDYTLESVTAALHKYFPAIETLPSDRDTRRLLVCRK